ncbi:MAG TPA: right-handed parallel beta-helix repeat-containing protein, partial [Methylomirabilota bacterium]|nr:right-handed parallel beta-helix repeat-containing protein [Methylomirabilota bacterium]
IRSGGEPGLPVVIRAKDPLQPPRIVYGGNTANVIDLRADHVTIRGLAIGPTQREVDGIRIFARRGITIEDCQFSGLGGIAVVADHNSSQGLTVRRNDIRNSESTAMYFGCHDGFTCVATDLTIEGNYVYTVRAPDPEIGYGIQVKLNSSGVIRGNMVLDTKGPGIMVYGASDTSRGSLIEGNVVMGSVRSSGIVAGGGPAVIRNNVSVGNAMAGVSIEDYARRGMLRAVVVAHNTLYRNEQGAVTVARSGHIDVTVMNNAVHSRPGSPILPEPQPGLRMTGNIDCRAVVCFLNPEADDFSPLPGGPLIGAGTVLATSWTPARDLFGAPRPVPPSTGAIEGLHGSIRLAPRP